MSFKSPRGTFTFDMAHNPVHDIVIRQTRSSLNGKDANVVIDRLPMVGDAG